METLYPFPHKVVQVRTRPPWLLEAEKHAKAVMTKKQTASPSSWDISQRLGEIAFGIKYQILTQYPEEGKRCPPFILYGTRVTIHTSPFDERYKSGSNITLRVMKKYAKNSEVHVLGMYDPPFIDLLGWTTLSGLMQSADIGGRSDMPISQLYPMTLLLGYLNS